MIKFHFDTSYDSQYRIENITSNEHVYDHKVLSLWTHQKYKKLMKFIFWEWNIIFSSNKKI